MGRDKDQYRKITAQLGEELGFTKKGYCLLEQALTHPTYFEGGPQGECGDNQRLEFLGDAVVDLLCGEYFFKLYPDAAEGELTKMRAAIVCEAGLSKKALEIGLDEKILLGRGSEAAGDRQRMSVLADAFEAVFGALFLNRGLDTARNLFIKLFSEEMDTLSKEDYEDKKSLLQEMVQSGGYGEVSYRLIHTEGPDHDKTFYSGAYCGKVCLGEAKGHSKKLSELAAAAEALKNKDKWLDKLRVKMK